MRWIGGRSGAWLVLVFLSGFGVGVVVPVPPPGAAQRAEAVDFVAGTPFSRSRVGREVRRLDDDSESGVPVEATVGGDGASNAQALSSREIAHRALGFTAFIRGRGVYGAGILIDGDGHVLTCHHVVEGLSEIRVSFADGASMPATVVDSDSKLDLALLKVEQLGSERATPASVAEVRMGDEVYGMGAPRKLRFSLSRGVVSYVGRPFSGAYYLQTDLPTNGGNSGGPVMNDRGEVIGVASFILKDSQGLAFALPIDYAYRRFADRIDGGPPEEPFEAWVRQWKQDKIRKAG